MPRIPPRATPSLPCRNRARYKTIDSPAAKGKALEACPHPECGGFHAVEKHALRLPTMKKEP
jgi:ribosomal protein L2